MPIACADGPDRRRRRSARWHDAEIQRLARIDTPLSASARGIRLALLAGFVFVAGAVAIALSRSPTIVTATNGVNASVTLVATTNGTEACQARETLPRETSALRLSLTARVGPRVTAAVLSPEGRMLTTGTHGSAWTTESVTVPVEPLAHTVSDATICLTIAPSRTAVDLTGAPTPPSIAARLADGRLLRGRIGVEYLRQDDQRWWSTAVPIARRMGLGRAAAGTWVAPFVIALMLALTSLVARLASRELASRHGPDAEKPPGGRRIGRLVHRPPAAAWLCALVAVLNAVCWSLISPPFQVTDEPNHFAYVQLLAESGRLPTTEQGDYSPEEQVALIDLRISEDTFQLARRPIGSEVEQRRLERDLAARPSRQGSGSAGSASSEPPLYYALEAIPYELGSGGSLLDRLELMRLLSALMAGITALCAYGFVREALPRSRWAWTVGGLAVALFPLLGVMSGAVNPDAMLFAVCAALYYLFARAFRQGLTRRLALTIGLVTAIGFATKLNFIGFAPGVLFGLLILGVRAWRRPLGVERSKGAVYGSVALALAIAAVPVLLDLAVAQLSNHSGLGNASETLTNARHSLWQEVSYIWQFYLPRLPGMHSYFPGILTTRQLWFNGLVGLYGWEDIPFPGWVYNVALVLAVVIVVLCARELIRRRERMLSRLPELATYFLFGLGVAVIVGIQSYTSDALNGGEPYWEPRYLLPMLSLWGLITALAARGAGRRWGPVVGVLIIALLLAHDVVSQLQVVGRFYG
jgi:hypothetical protein